jgi:acetylornithine deacetylase/succinyl-diaminopimelate desuccinylase-like protein
MASAAFLHLVLFASQVPEEFLRNKPYRNVSEYIEAARVLVGIELMAPQMENDPFLGKATLAVTEIESSALSRNAIPDHCVLYVDRRLTGGETEAKAVAQLRSLIHRENVDATVEVTEYDTHSYTGYGYRVRQYFPPSRPSLT